MKSRYEHESERITEITHAMLVNINHEKALPTEWIYEYNELCNRKHKVDRHVDSIEKEAFTDRLLGTLDLSIRSQNCLRTFGIQTVGQLTQMTETDLARTENFGKKSINELKEKLSELGLSLKETL